jgi:hypothetical protein
VTSYSETVWLAYMAAMRRSSGAMSSMSVLLLQVMNRTSSGAKSGSFAMYDSRRAVCSDVVFIEGSGSWGPVFYYLGSESDGFTPSRGAPCQ